MLRPDPFGFQSLWALRLPNITNPDARMLSRLDQLRSTIGVINKMSDFNIK